MVTCSASVHGNSFGASPYTATKDVETLLNGINPISLSEMDGVALLDRTDTKFVMSSGQLYDALAALRDQYRVLEVADRRVQPYRTLYFDTPNFDLYMRHHAGRRNRFKVRSREYVHTGLTFFEVKHKTKGDRTKKTRVRTDQLWTNCDDRAQAFVDANLPPETRTLEPTLSNAFSRVTLVSKTSAERLTIDLDVGFSHAGQRVALPGLAIAEVKRDGRQRGSHFMLQMRAMGLRQMGFSKYCVGVSLLHTHLKHNRFNRSLNLVRRLTHSNHAPHASH